MKDLPSNLRKTVIEKCEKLPDHIVIKLISDGLGLKFTLNAPDPVKLESFFEHRIVNGREREIPKKLPNGRSNKFINEREALFYADQIMNEYGNQAIYVKSFEVMIPCAKTPHLEK